MAGCRVEVRCDDDVLYLVCEHHQYWRSFGKGGGVTPSELTLAAMDHHPRERRVGRGI